MLDYYRVLGVDRSADASAVKAGYQKLVLRYHPDRNKSAGAARRLAEVLEAYDVLSDPDRRREYDHQQDIRYSAREDVLRDAGPGRAGDERQDAGPEQPAEEPRAGRDDLVICGFCGDDAVYDAGMGEVVCHHCGYTGPPDT